MNRDDALSRAEQQAIRDIPLSCNCTRWEYRVTPAQWVLPLPQRGCPWHLSRERAA